MSDGEMTCLTCGGRLKQRGRRSVCPRCLLAGTVAESASEISATSPPVTIELPEIEDLQAAFPELVITRLIGVGGMGMVYEAVQKALGRKVALKILRLESVNLEFTERFQREAQTLAKLSHPNVVSIFDQGERDSWVFILMEYVEGSDLSRLMDGGALSLEQSVAIADSIFAALSHAHEQGVVHRDIKPANILLDRSGAVKIADFGLAKYAAGNLHQFSLTSGGSSLGTPLYMAPEQRKGAADTDSRADIYSVGVVLYEMLTGEVPVGRVRAPSESVDIPVALDEVVLKAIEPSPDDRFSTSAEMAEAMKVALDGKSTSLRWLPIAAAVMVLTGVAYAAWPRGEVLPELVNPENPIRTVMPPPKRSNPRIVEHAEPVKLPEIPSIREVRSDDPSVIALTAIEPVSGRFFGGLIEAGADILVVGYSKIMAVEPKATEVAGEVYVYQIGVDEKVGDPVILQSETPSPGDHFGRYVAVSPLGDFIAVVSSEPAPGESGGDCVTIFERDGKGSNAWKRAAKFYIEEGFDNGRYAMRVTASNDLVALGSPDFDDEKGAVRLFERIAGKWQQREDLLAELGDENSKFGVTTVRHSSGKLLAVSANTYNLGAAASAGKVVIYRHGTNGLWVKQGELFDSEPSRWELFGLELRASGDVLAISSPGDRVGDVLAAGGISIFDIDDTEPAGWRRVMTLRPPLASPKRLGFGGRFDLDGDWLAAMTVQSAKSGIAHSLVYVVRREAESAGWKFVGAVSGAPDEEVWLGRVVLGESFIACGHLGADVGDELEAGKVYVIPKSLFDADEPE